MNVNTGELRFMNEQQFQDELKNEFGDWKPINMDDATDKQKDEMQVSKHDNNSKLGKFFAGNRRQRRAQERAYNKSRKIQKTK